MTGQRPSHLGDVLGFAYPDFDAQTLDAAVSLDAGIRCAMDDGGLPSVADKVAEIVAQSTTEEDAHDALSSWVGYLPVPDGGSYLEYLRAVHRRVQEALDDPSVIPEADFSPGWGGIRETAWHPEVDVEQVVQLVLRQHGPVAEAWAADPMATGWTRQHYFADLTDHLAQLGPLGLIAPSLLDQGRLVPNHDVGLPATSAIVVLMHGSCSKEVTVHAAHPDQALDTGLREQYPDLCHWFGGFLTQGSGAPPGNIAAACRSTRDPARSRVREQLTMLLHQDEQTIRAVLHATGSFVLPRNASHWLDRILWRIDAFDWFTDVDAKDAENAASQAPERDV